jgi:hypothetical protein
MIIKLDIFIFELAGHTDILKVISGASVLSDI